jgi:hypothetical protein
MRKTVRWPGWALVALVGLSGCAVPDFFGLNLLQGTGPGGERVVAGSLESVSLSTKSRLEQLGLSAAVTNREGEVRIASTTRAGARFVLVLTRVQGEKGESTRMRVEWADKVDGQAGVQVLSMLEAQSVAGGSGTTK